MKIVAISDIHNNINKMELPPGDLLCIAGDLTMRGTIQEFIKLNTDLDAIKEHYKHGILAIPGNHDFACEHDFNVVKMLTPNIKYFIHHESIVIDDVKFFGSAFTPRFYDWAFNVDRGTPIKAKWDAIPDDTDVLITHGPPLGILDEPDIFSGHVGCADLLDAILRVNPKVSIFGHIHEGYGEKTFHNTHFINASSCNHKYKAVNAPIIVEI